MSEPLENLIWLVIAFVVGYALAALFDLILRHFLSGFHRIAFPAVAGFFIIVTFLFNMVPVESVSIESYLWALFSTFLAMLLVIAARNWRLSGLDRHDDSDDSGEFPNG